MQLVQTNVDSFLGNAQVNHIAARSKPILYPPKNPIPEYISLSAAKLSTSTMEDKTN